MRLCWTWRPELLWNTVFCLLVRTMSGRCSWGWKIGLCRLWTVPFPPRTATECRSGLSLHFRLGILPCRPPLSPLISECRQLGQIWSSLWVVQSRRGFLLRWGLTLRRDNGSHRIGWRRSGSEGRVGRRLIFGFQAKSIRSQGIASRKGRSRRCSRLGRKGRGSWEGPLRQISRWSRVWWRG